MGDEVQSWIFQANPDRFDIDGYLQTRPHEFSWLVTRYQNELNIGDRVYIWRSKGTGNGTAGIIAESRVVHLPVERLDESVAQPYWKSDAENQSPRPRVLLKLIRVANKKEIVKRDWLIGDPILSDLTILTMANATNYRIDEKHIDRLESLWAKTGNDWNRDESVAGLWAYQQTLGQEVSRGKGTPVSIVSILIGRAVTGVYNKVMNFRSLDPRDDRKGLSGGGNTDKVVWKEYFDEGKNSLMETNLDDEFHRLWGDELRLTKSQGLASGADVIALKTSYEKEVERWEQKGLSELIDQYARKQNGNERKPNVTVAKNYVYDRDPLVAAIARERAEHNCEVPNCSFPLFKKPNDVPYSEVHHIIPLSEGGKDVIENVACLCPAHHRELHYGREASNMRQRLIDVRSIERS